MYIQITTRCNFDCLHCCYACTETGEDMTMEVFEKAVELTMDMGDSISIGGGEPTIHPKFWNMMIHCLGQQYMDEGMIWLATNGSQTEISLALAKMAKSGVIGCALSRDDYHCDIDPQVVEAFTPPKTKRIHTYTSASCDRNNDFREIRTVREEHLVNQGRCDFGCGKNTCACEGLFVQPDGKIKACGCDDSPVLGDVFTINLDDIVEYARCGQCHKEQENETDSAMELPLRKCC